MPHRHQVTSREVGQVRIYMSQGERRTGSGNSLKRLFSGSPPLYKEIIRAAKASGLLNASAHHTHYGFSGSGEPQGDTLELSNPALNLYVELIGSRGQLERFCRTHGSLLAGKVIIYKHMEHWEISERTLHASQAPLAEYLEPESVINGDGE